MANAAKLLAHALIDAISAEGEVNIELLRSLDWSELPNMMQEVEETSKEDSTPASKPKDPATPSKKASEANEPQSTDKVLATKKNVRR